MISFRKPKYTLDEVYRQTEVISMLQEQRTKANNNAQEFHTRTQADAEVSRATVAIEVAQKVLERMLETMEGAGK